MAEQPAPEEGLVVALPDDLGRTMRLGPFPSVRDALKFTTYAAIGAVAATVVAPLWWLPFLGGGFALSVYRPEGKGLDERLGELVAFELRRGRGVPRPPVRDRGRPAPPSAPWIPLDRHLVGVLAVGGVPVAFLPPAEARSLFDRYRAMLAAVEGGLYLSMGVRPLDERPFRPPRRRADNGPAPRARAGYYEMVQLLCRRRLQRQTRVVVWVDRDGPGAGEELEHRLRIAGEQLERMGVRPRRLRGPELRAATRSIGWGAAASG